MNVGMGEMLNAIPVIGEFVVVGVLLEEFVAAGVLLEEVGGDVTLQLKGGSDGAVAYQRDCHDSHYSKL